MKDDSIIIALLAFPALSGVVFLWGHLIIYRLLKLRLRPSLYNVPIILCAGFTCVHQVAIIICALRLLYPTVLYLALFAILPYLFICSSIPGELRKIVSDFIYWLKGVSLFRKIILSACGFIISVYFTGTLTPPAGGQGNDVLRYHLSALQEFIRNHGFVYMPDIVHTNSPFAIDFLFLPGYMIGGALLAQLTSWLLYCCLILSTAGLGRYILKAVSGGQTFIYPEFAPVLITLTPLVSRYSDTCFVDNGMALFVIVSIWAFYRFGESFDLKWVLLGASFLGMATGAKYTALFLFPAFILSYGVLIHRSDNKKKFFLAVPLIVVACVLFTGGLWYLKNYILTNNPVFPAFYKIFGGNEYWTSRTDEMFSCYIKERGKGLGKNLISLLSIGWNFTIYSEKFHNWQTITPVYLSLFPACFLIKRNSKALPLIIIFCVFSLLWFYFDQEARFIIPILPIAAIMIHSGLENILHRDKKVLIPVQALLLITAIFSVSLAGGHLKKNIPVLTGVISHIDYQKRNLDYSDAYDKINSIIKPDSRVLMIKGNTENGLVRYFINGSSMVYIQGYPEICGFKSTLSEPGRFIKELREKGFTLVLDVQGHFNSPSWNHGLVVIDKGDGWVLYGVK